MWLDPHSGYACRTTVATPQPNPSKDTLGRPSCTNLQTQVATSYKATDLIQAELLCDFRPRLPGQNIFQLHIQLLLLLDEQVLQKKTAQQ